MLVREVVLRVCDVTAGGGVTDGAVIEGKTGVGADDAMRVGLKVEIGLNDPTEFKTEETGALVKDIIDPIGLSLDDDPVG